MNIFIMEKVSVSEAFIFIKSAPELQITVILQHWRLSGACFEVSGQNIPEVVPCSGFPASTVRACVRPRVPVSNAADIFHISAVAPDAKDLSRRPPTASLDSSSFFLNAPDLLSFICSC